MLRISLFTLLLLISSCYTEKAEETRVVSPFLEWENFNPSHDDLFFPIGVYTQNPEHAGEYRKLGINLYYYLWKGPTAEQVDELRKHGMRLISEFNEYARENLINDTIVAAWTHLDEPDLVKFSKKRLEAMGQEKTKALVKEMWPKMYDEMNLDNEVYNGWGFGYSPEYCRDQYRDIKGYDTTRPVIMGLSKGVVSYFNGRGDRKGHREDYREYAEGAGDILAFDIYPVAYGYPEKMHMVADGVDSLASWDAGERPKFVAIECTFGSPDHEIATPAQIRSEIWMAIIRGARGIGYFVHNFDKEGKFVRSDGLLANPEMMEAIEKQNAELLSLRKPIFAKETNEVSLINDEQPVDFVAKRVDGYLYIFASANRPVAIEAEFLVEGMKNGVVEVINENRTLEMKEGVFTGRFTDSFDVNLYRVEL